MLIEDIKIWLHQGQQFIKDIDAAQVPAPFRGRPILSQEGLSTEIGEELTNLCPTEAIGLNPLSLDLGKCVFCGECAQYYPQHIQFSNDHRIGGNSREGLIVKAGETSSIHIQPELIRKEIMGIFGSSLKLRQISAAGDNSHEAELNACGNVNFDMGRFGVEFVASPRHADGIVITGPISENMALATKICYEAVPKPSIVVLCGTDAISGGIFAGSGALQRKFLEEVPIDLYVPGNPAHPLTFIQAILALTRKRAKQ